jgi:hypothetical protein
MSNLNRNRSFIGGGKIYIQELVSGVPKPAYAFGNADSFSFAIGEDKKTQRNYQQPGGGNIASQSAITDVTATINALSFQPATLATALRSLVTTIPSAAVTAEVARAFKDGFIKLAKLPDSGQTITVTGAGGTPTYVLNTDYTVEGGGLFIPEGSAITAADATNVGVSIRVTYTSVATFKIEAITQSSIEYRLVFDGFNDADNGKPVTVVCHKIKFSPTQALDLISEDFGALPITFEILADDTIVAAGASKYFNVEMVQ